MVVTWTRARTRSTSASARAWSCDRSGSSPRNAHAWSSTAALHSADSCAGNTATHSLSPTTWRGPHPHRPLQPRLGRPDPHRVGVHPHQRPPDPGPHPAPGLGADPRQHHRLHPGARLPRWSRPSRPPRSRPATRPGSPAPIAANIPGSRDTSPAAVRTRSSAPREVNPSIGATVTAANSLDEPRPPVHRHPRPVRALHLVAGGDPGQPDRLHRRRRVHHPLRRQHHPRQLTPPSVSDPRAVASSNALLHQQQRPLQ